MEDGAGNGKADRPVKLPDDPISALVDLSESSIHFVCFGLSQLLEYGEMTITMDYLAKMHNAKKARQVCADARDILGGNGILLEYHVARHWADIEATYSYEGTDAIQSFSVGREITGFGAFT